MVIKQKLQTKLAQKLVLTPSLQQAIKLLPMSTLELSNMLNQEVVENPMLEEVPLDELDQEETLGIDQTTSEGEKDALDDADYEYFLGENLDDSRSFQASKEVSEFSAIEKVLATSNSIVDHLMWQLSMQAGDDVTREIGTSIIGNISKDGYLGASVEEISEMGNWPIEEISRVLKIVQGFDPVGVAARDLRECLLLQIEHLGLALTPAEKIVSDYLHLLQNHRVSEIAQKMDLSIEALKEYVAIIKRLDPKPGSRYNSEPAQHVIPDVYVVKVDGQYIAVLNDDGLPKLRISPAYRVLLSKSGNDNEETRTYVRSKYKSALWLIKSVYQRQKTIYRVATSIIKFQQEFLDQGIASIRPLVLQDVASDIGMHESTISRIVNNKYMHTPQGVFEMRYFFHSEINSSSSNGVSSLFTKQLIQKLISKENSSKPLSDSKIVSFLQEQGHILSRRTIAKYRAELKIPTANKRKSLF